MDSMIKQRNPARERKYEQLQAKAREDFHAYAQQLYDGEITPEEFRQKMRDRLKLFYLAIAMAGGTFDAKVEADRADMQLLLGGTYELLDDFVDRIEEADLSSDTPAISSNFLLWNAGIYSFARATYTRYTVDDAIFSAMPVFPGVDCLGDGACGCDLEVVAADEGVYVYWYVNIAKENCAICLSAAAESPFFFYYDELQ